MRSYRGFTLVEVLITITIMAILLTLGVALFSNSQIQARDTERRTDAEAIARGLERYYERGNPFLTYFYNFTHSTQGSYPGYVEFSHMGGHDYCSIGNWATVFDACTAAEGVTFEKGLPGVTPASTVPPNVTIPSGGRGIYAQGGPGAETTTAANQKLDDGYYIYDPRAGTTLCYGVSDDGNPPQKCTSFVIKYKEEASGNIIEIKSKHT